MGCAGGKWLECVDAGMEGRDDGLEVVMEEVVMMCLGLGESLVVVLEVVMEEVVMVCLGFGLSLVVVLDNVSRYCVNDWLGAEKEL